MKVEIDLFCPGCGSGSLARNGRTRHGVQRFKCTVCGRQFGWGGPDRARGIPDEVVKIIDRMLAGGFSVRQIFEVTGVSKAWVYKRAKTFTRRRMGNSYVG